MKVISTTICLFLVYLSAFGQVRLEGHILGGNEKGKQEPLPFANVVLKNAEDSVKIDFAAITDLKGYYAFENISMKSFLLEISSLGYYTHKERIEITFPEVGNTSTIDFTLQSNSKQLDEVVITANVIQRGLDKTTYLITSDDMKSARFSMDLLEIVPSISIDPVSQMLKSANGDLKILIDGISSGEIDLKAIPPNKVARIEYYDIPPARYIGYGAVINVVTKNMEDGFAFGTTLQHAFTTGFFNDDLFLKFNRGRHQVSADYRTNYRNYTDVKTETKYDYLVNGKPLIRKENSDNPFGYNDHFINLKYTNQLQNNYAFQAKFSPDLNFRRSEDNSEIQILQDENPRKRIGIGSNKSNIFNPTLNLYYWKQLKNKQAITFDAIGNLFNSHQTISKQEYNTTDNNLDLDDRMELKSLKKSFIGELVYDKKIGISTKLNIGNKIEIYNINSEVNNSFNNSNYTSSYFSNYLYGDYTGIIGKFMYRATIGLTYKNTNNAITKYSSWILSPMLLLGYTINNHNNVRFLFVQAPREPDISEQSDNMIFVTDNILKKGNPYLKNSLARVFYLKYSFKNKYLDFTMDAYYPSAKNNIATYYVKTDDYYLLTSMNDKQVTSYGFDISGAIKPLGNDVLTLKLNGGMNKYIIQNEIIGNFSHWYNPFNYQIILKTGNWIASYQGIIVSYDWRGTYLKKDENNQHFTLRYNRKNFSISAGLLFAFASSNYITETIPTSIVQYSNNCKIYDNKNMLTLGFTYTFNSGKKYEEKEKLIDNKDSDAGLFR
jgi:hypothetical protein